MPTAAGSSTRPRSSTTVPTADVLAGRADEPARAGVEADEHGVALDGGLLHRHHRVRPRGQRAAGHDADGRARLDGGQPAGPGEHLAGDLQGHRGRLAGAGQVGPAHGEPVHGRVGERRQVLGRGDVGGQDAPDGVGQPGLPDRERGQPLEHARPGLGERHQVGRVGTVGRELGVPWGDASASPAPAPPPAGPGRPRTGAGRPRTPGRCRRAGRPARPSPAGSRSCRRRRSGSR